MINQTECFKRDPQQYGRATNAPAFDQDEDQKQKWPSWVFQFEKFCLLRGSLISLKPIHELLCGIATCPDGLGFNKRCAIRVFAVKSISKGSIIARNLVSSRDLGLVAILIIPCHFYFQTIVMLHTELGDGCIAMVQSMQVLCHILKHLFPFVAVY